MCCRKVMARIGSGTLAVLLLAIVALLPPNTIEPSRAAGSKTSADQIPPVVTTLEQRLFFKNYSEDELSVRVERIEKQVFGEALAGQMQERLGRLEEFLAQRQKEEQQKDEAQAAQKAAEQAAKQVAESRHPARNQPPVPSSDDSDIERARVAIQAAREQEIADLLAQGVELWRNKRGQQALERFEQVLRLDPHNAESHFSMGIIEESAGNYVEALSSYRQAMQSDPSNREYKDAVAVVEKKAQSKQRTTGLQADLKILAENALAAFKRGEYNSALDLYMQLDAKAPSQPLVKYNMGTIYLVMKDQSTALSYYQQAHKLDPKNERYAKAYAELAAAVKKVEKEQAGDARLEDAELKQAQATSKKSSGKVNRSALSSPRGGSGMSAPFGMPTPGRSSFGVNPAMFQHGVPAPRPQAPGGVMSAPQAPSQQDVMASFGLMGSANGQGVTLTNVGIASRAQAAGLQPGDDIKAVDGIQVYKPEDINRILQQKGSGAQIQMLIMRNGNLAVVNL